MSNDNEPDVVAGLLGLVAFGLLCWGLFYPIRGTYRWMNQERGYYCESKKAVAGVEPVYEDNGKYEDEAYIIKYKDGSTGVTSNPDIAQSGYVCVNETWMTAKDGKSRGWIKL